jgi:disulfide bond formation protein DsbB
MAFAMYLQHILELEPCPLCITQRAFVILTGLFALIAALHNPQGLGAARLRLLCLLAAVPGAAVAARHVWLQHLPEELAPACGPSLEYMLETLPLSETFAAGDDGRRQLRRNGVDSAGLQHPGADPGLFVVLGGIAVPVAAPRPD